MDILVKSVIWNALQYRADTLGDTDEDRARFCQHLSRQLYPYADFITDPRVHNEEASL